MKKLVTLILALAMILSAFACASAEETNLIMWTFLDANNPTNGRATALAQLIDNFEAANPGITVTVEAQDHSTLAAKYYAAWQAGNAPDVVQVNLGAESQASATGEE